MQQRFIDNIDRNIITSVQQSPDLRQSQIAKRLGITQSAVAARWRKLRESGPVSIVSGLDLKKLGLEIARLDVTTKNPKPVLEWAAKCPLIVNGTVGVGDGSLSLFLTSEDIEMFQYVVNNHLRVIEGVKAVKFLPVLSWIKQFPAQLNLDVPKSNVPPCSALPYCPKCPANPMYDGRIWDGHSPKFSRAAGGSLPKRISRGTVAKKGTKKIKRKAR